MIPSSWERAKVGRNLSTLLLSNNQLKRPLVNIPGLIRLDVSNNPSLGGELNTLLEPYWYVNDTAPWNGPTVQLKQLDVSYTVN